MGNFYVNYTLRGVTQDAVAKVLLGRTCIVTPSTNDTVVAFDEESDNQDQRVISSLATELSQKLRCPVLAVLNHDDDILWYQLYTDGKLQDEYDSAPGYFDPSAEPSAPAGGDAAKLCAAFGSTKKEEVERVLRKSSFDDDGYTFELERHGDLVSALGISTYGVGTGYASFEHDELPDGLSADDVVRLTYQGVLPNSADEGLIVIDIREDVPELLDYVRRRVDEHIAKVATVNRLPPVKMIEFGFEFGQANWVALVFDTRPDAEPDGEWTREIDDVMFERPKWPIWHELPEDVHVYFIDVAGKKIDVMENPDEIICNIVGEAMKHVLLTAREQGVFNKLPKAEKCELGVENFEGFYGWPAYEDRGRENLA